MISPSLRRRRLLLFLTGGISQQVGMFVQGAVVTLSAIILLETSYSQIGLTQAIGTLLALLLALPLGVLIDRARRRSALVATGLLSAGLLASVVVAAWLQVITVPHFMVVTVALAILQTVGEGAQNAYLPAVVGRDRLVPVNAALVGVASISPLVISLLANNRSDTVVPVILSVAAVAFAASALLFRSIDAPEEPPGPQVRWWREAIEGVRFILMHPVLRAITVYLVVSVLLEPVIEEATQVPHPEEGVRNDLIELLPMMIYAAPVVGALLAALLYRRVGTFRLAWLAVLVTQPFALLLALTDTAWGLVWYLLGTFVPWAGWTATALALLSHRQVITPGRLLGRMGGTLALFIGLAGVAGSFLEPLADFLIGLGSFTEARSLAGLPVLVLGTAGLLAAAVPLLKVRHLTEPSRSPAIPLTSSPHED
ncbi:MFS transporter [Streptosporangium canum]|uniref:MFS transporter n=1 Tax=Streptosporangium canum TaxID=324952 RepID=UPI00369112A1